MSLTIQLIAFACNGIAILMRTSTKVFAREFQNQPHPKSYFSSTFTLASCLQYGPYPMETVMEQTLPIFVDERRCMLNVKIQVQPKKFIDIQITDEKDYFFLLMLQINENDYLNLKKEMGLLVEFSAFPKNLVELFDKCKEEKELQCRLESQTNLLSFVSISYTNLRPLVHFYLQLKSANDATLKKYLSSQVHEFKVTICLYCRLNFSFRH
jgi:hypothetical protein